MEKVKNKDTQFELVVFSQQVLDKAITTRLSFAQKKSNNYQALEYELPNLWEVAQKSYAIAFPISRLESTIRFLSFFTLHLLAIG